MKSTLIPLVTLYLAACGPDPKAEDTAKLRNADYQLAYAIDILTGLNALGPKN